MKGLALSVVDAHPCGVLTARLVCASDSKTADVRSDFAVAILTDLLAGLG